MKLIIERAALLRILSHANGVVEKRNTIPILANVKLVAENNTLSLTATDLEIAIVEQAPADVLQAGQTTAPAQMLFDIARNLPDGSQVELTFNADDGRLTVRSSRSTFALSCLPTEDFPVMSEGDLPHAFRIGREDLGRLFDKTRFAISTEETRYYLNGVYLHPIAADDPTGSGTPVMRAVATDGHRLARAEIALPEGAAEAPGVIVPRKTVQEVLKLLDESGGAVDISLSDSKIRFAIGEMVLTSKLIDGTFPDYQRVIPSGNERRLEVDCETFSRAVNRVSIISSEKSRAVKLAMASDTLVLSANSPDAGSATDEVPVTYQGGEPMEIGFNSRYLLDITQQIEGETARFELADAASPTIIRDAGDESALYVLMPMRV